MHVFIQRIMEHVIKHQTEATNSVEVWKTQCATYLTARLDQLLQHHRPKIGVMEETWCENARLTLKGMRNVLAQFLQKQTAAIASQVCSDHWRANRSVACFILCHHFASESFPVLSNPASTKLSCGRLRTLTSKWSGQRLSLNEILRT